MLAVAVYGYPSDPERTSVLLSELFEAAASDGGPFIRLGDFNLSQALACGRVRAADDACQGPPPPTNSLDARRIDFALTHSELHASEVETFRLPAVSAVSDPALIVCRFASEAFPDTWHRPRFAWWPAPDETRNDSQGPVAPLDIQAALGGGHIDEAWSARSDW